MAECARSASPERGLDLAVLGAGSAGLSAPITATEALHGAHPAARSVRSLHRRGRAWASA